MCPVTCWYIHVEFILSENVWLTKTPLKEIEITFRSMQASPGDLHCRRLEQLLKPITLPTKTYLLKIPRCQCRQNWERDHRRPRQEPEHLPGLQIWWEPTLFFHGSSHKGAPVSLALPPDPPQPSLCNPNLCKTRLLWEGMYAGRRSPCLPSTSNAGMAARGEEKLRKLTPGCESPCFRPGELYLGIEGSRWRRLWRSGLCLGSG